MDIPAKYFTLKPSVDEVVKRLSWCSHSYLPGFSFFACQDKNTKESSWLKDTLTANKHSWQWPYLWTSGITLARWILDNPSTVTNKIVYDLGTGQGAVAIAAKKAGAKMVVGVDCCAYSEFALEVNSERNNVATHFLNRDILINLRVPDHSVVFASDVIYGQPTSKYLLQKFLQLSKTSTMIVAQTMRTNPSYSYPIHNITVLVDEVVPVEFNIEQTKDIQVKLMQLQNV